jgi:hypothetical protein
MSLAVVAALASLSAIHAQTTTHTGNQTFRQQLLNNLTGIQGSLNNPNSGMAAATRQAAFTGGAFGGAAGSSAGYAADPYTPYGGYYESPTAGYLRGTADVVNSTGRFLINLQQSNLLREQVQQEKVRTRRAVFDQWLYEREKGPTWEQERQRYLREVTSRSLNDPTSTEIWSATALNFVLADIQKKLGNQKGVQAPQIGVDEDVLRHINLTSGKGDGNAGLLKNEGRLSWPLTLRGDEYKKDRELLNNLTPEVINQAINGRVDAGTLNEIMAAANRMHDQLVSSIKDLPPSQYMEAKRFLGNLDAAIKVLRQPDAGDYFTQKYAAKGKNVAELVDYMTKKGLKFAPAVDGDEAAYSALHRALVNFDAGASAQLAAEVKP